MLGTANATTDLGVSGIKNQNQMPKNLSKMKTIIKIIAFFSWLICASAFIYYAYLAGNSPGKPSGDNLYMLLDAGETFYITIQQYYLFYGLLWVGAGVFCVLVGLLCIIQRKEEYPKAFTGSKLDWLLFISIVLVGVPFIYNIPRFAKTILGSEPDLFRIILVALVSIGVIIGAPILAYQVIQKINKKSKTNSTD